MLAVKAKPLRGRFASLDRCARRWRFGFQVALLTKSGPRAAFAHQRDLIGSCRAAPAQSSRTDWSEAQERRSRLTATGRRGWAGWGFGEVATLRRVKLAGTGGAPDSLLAFFVRMRKRVNADYPICLRASSIKSRETTFDASS